MQPPAEHVHWLFATGVLLLGLLLLAEAIVGREVWRRRKWRAYLLPSLLFGLGVFMWPVMVLFTNSTIHMLAHSSWAADDDAGGRGRARSRQREAEERALEALRAAALLAVSGTAFLIHEANPWFYARSAFVHHICGWLLLIGALFPLARRVQAAVARLPTRATRSCSSGSRSPCTRPATSRRSSATSARARGRRTGEARSRRRARRARVPRGGLGARDARADLAEDRRSGSRVTPREVRLQFDQSVRVLANGIQVYDAKGRLVSGAPHMLAGNSRVVVGAAPPAAARGLHGPLGDDLQRQPRRPRCLHVRRPGRRRRRSPRRTAPPGRGRRSTSSAGSTSSASRC